MTNIIRIKESNIHGKGVFAECDLNIGSLLVCDVLLINKNENCLNKYHYPWSKDFNSICIGFGSFFNHSNDPNVKIYVIDKEKLTKTFILIKPIKRGEELFLKYNNSVIFNDDKA